MALKPTIWKFAVTLADVDRDCYEDLNLTIAQHPSETPARMMARVLALCLFAEEGPTMTRGLSDNDEPDLWVRSLDNRILRWIEVGEPAPERLRKAAGISERVTAVTFNRKSDLWWQRTAPVLEGLPVDVHQLATEAVETLATLIDRTAELTVTITRPSLFVTTPRGEVDVVCTQLL